MRKVMVLVFLLTISSLLACNDSEAPDSNDNVAVKAKNIRIYSSRAVEGRTIKKIMGQLSAWKVYDGTVPFKEVYGELDNVMREEAANVGANALVGMSITAVPFEQQGSKWGSSVVVMSADQVILE